MSAFSVALEQRLHRHLLRTGVALAQPTNLYLALFDTSGDPDVVVIPANEVSEATYAREDVTTKFSETGGNPSQAQNNADVTFPVAGGAWGTIFQWGILDALTGGSLLFNGTWAAAKTIETNDQFQLGIGDLTIAFD